MFDSAILDEKIEDRSAVAKSRGQLGFAIFKRVFDVLLSLALLPVFMLCALALLVLNPVFNRGPLFYVQKRMGQNCVAFTAIKFRTMTPTPEVSRDANAPLEVDRITPLGGFLRKARIDELPQILNVLLGDMSLIGPRPDYYDHALHYLNEIPGYRARHAVRPGISGLAQTEVGYVETVEQTRRKVRADLYYIAKRCVRLELWILWRTVTVIVRRSGA